MWPSERNDQKPSTEEPPRFLSVPQVARTFGVSAVTVYRAIAAGEFPAVRIRGRLIVPAHVVDAMANGTRIGSTARTPDALSEDL